MRFTRIFTTQLLTVGSEIVLNAEAAHHILRVLRLKQGEKLKLFNGENFEYIAGITYVNKNSVKVFVEEKTMVSIESPLNIHLAQAISRGEKMDYTIQKATELGVKSIVPIFTGHCNVILEGARLEKKVHHWQTIAINAAEQSGRCQVPKIYPAQQLTAWLMQANPGLKLALCPKATTSIPKLIAGCAQSVNKITLLVGPEGGLTNDEIQSAKNCGFTAVNLGPRILRTETGALVAISILQGLLGDLK